MNYGAEVVVLGLEGWDVVGRGRGGRLEGGGSFPLVFRSYRSKKRDSHFADGKFLCGSFQ